ncbi:MAG: hypothetical protein OMOMHJEC_02973 [Xanthomonadales bacterium]|nr:hypothetical protein [Xanthomonadales bacterium]
MPTHTAAATSRRRNIQPGKDRSEQRRARAAERRKLAAQQAGALLEAGGLLRLPEVLALVPVSASVWWEGCRTGRFPTPVKLSQRCTCWRAEDLRALIARLGSEAQP